MAEAQTIDIQIKGAEVVEVKETANYKRYALDEHLSEVTVECCGRDMRVAHKGGPVICPGCGTEYFLDKRRDTFLYRR